MELLVLLLQYLLHQLLSLDMTNEYLLQFLLHLLDLLYRFWRGLVVLLLSLLWWSSN